MFKQGKGAIMAPKTKKAELGAKEVHDKKVDKIMEPLYAVTYYARSVMSNNLFYTDSSELRDSTNEMFMETEAIANSPLIRLALEKGILKTEAKFIKVKMKDAEGNIIGYKTVFCDGKKNIYISNLLNVFVGDADFPKTSINDLLKGFTAGRFYGDHITDVYKPFSWSPSQERNSQILFAAAEEDAIEAVIDAVGGGILLEKMKALAGDEKAFKKLGARLGMFSSPALEAGKIGWEQGTGILVLNEELEGPSDFNDLIAKELAGIENDRSTYDGAGYYRADLMMDSLNYAAGAQIIESPAEAARYAAQERLTHVYGKICAHALMVSSFSLLQKHIEDNYENYRIFGNPENVVAILDSNAAKIIDFDFLEEKLNKNKESIQLYLLAVSKEHKAHTGSQLFSKLMVFDAEKTLSWVKERKTAEVDDIINNAGEGNGSIYDNNSYFVDAVLNSIKDNDELFGQLIRECPPFLKAIVSNSIRKLNADIKGFRVDLPESVSETALFDPTYMISNKKMDGVLGVTPEGQIEVFCPDLTGIPEACDMAGLKYPAPGLYDCALFKRVSLDQIRQRLIQTGGLSNEEVRGIYEIFKYAPFGAVIIAPVNFLKRKLAGMDTDYDAVVLFWNYILEQIIKQGFNKEAKARGIHGAWSGPIPYMIYGTTK